MIAACGFRRVGPVSFEIPDWERNRLQRASIPREETRNGNLPSLKAFIYLSDNGTVLRRRRRQPQQAPQLAQGDLLEHLPGRLRDALARHRDAAQQLCEPVGPPRLNVQREPPAREHARPGHGGCQVLRELIMSRQAKERVASGLAFSLRSFATILQFKTNKGLVDVPYRYVDPEPPEGLLVPEDEAVATEAATQARQPAPEETGSKRRKTET
ncbi:hypothetical protein LZ554_005392 [Drepanopeziza brunnea f. sp. 'monogermtubi']|nr:hypothetical protein LZ554_005392 [Drepanopeziza brunnea f. sp. 'monogermtubi']